MKPIDGLLVLNKPQGWTSQEAVTKVKHLLDASKAGHFGTLDPMARGILLVALGRATRLFDHFVHQEKVYSGTIRFGQSTDTYDAEGQPVGEAVPANMRTCDLNWLREGFVGTIEQLPPLYSAKKVRGKPLYAYARRNQEVERKPCQVTIHSLDLLCEDEQVVRFRARTSSGTYIRTLAHDLGQKMGCGAHLASLIREGIGAFGLEQAITLEDLEALGPEERLGRVLPLGDLLAHYPRVLVGEMAARGVLNGQPVMGPDILAVDGGGDFSFARIVGPDGHILALARRDSILKRYLPVLVFSVDD